MHARFQFIEMFVDLEARTVHEVGREKSCNALDHPGVVFDVPITGSKFDSFVHWDVFENCWLREVAGPYSSVICSSKNFLHLTYLTEEKKCLKKPSCYGLMSERPFCKICEKAWPSQDHFIGDLGLTKAYLFEDQFFAGWTVLILQDHHTELFQLTREERMGLIEEVSRVGEAMTEIFEVKKINSELLGNQTPHIHWHVIPRLHSDPDPLSPVWCVSHEPVHLSADLLENRLSLFRGGLGIS